MATFDFDPEAYRIDHNGYHYAMRDLALKNAAQYDTEDKASQFIRELLNAQGWAFDEQVRTKSGKKVDFVVRAYEATFAIECKRRMTVYHNNGLNATTLADYLEQAAAYSADLDMPVFLGPVQKNMTPMSACTGGINIDSVAALNIFGGRLNVGTLIVHGQNNLQRMVGNEPYWFLFLRGAAFWTQRDGFNEKRLNMVCSTGSKKERKSLNDSQDSVVVFGSQGLQELPPSVPAGEGTEELHQKANRTDAVWHGSAQGAGGLRPGWDPFTEKLPAVPEATRSPTRDGGHEVP